MRTPLPRRQVLGQLAAGSAIALAPRAFAQMTGSSGRTLRIGMVSPQTGALAAFGEADRWTLESLKKTLAEGVVVNGSRHPIEVLLKDSQSNPNRAAEVANDLILKDKIDLMVVTSTPETTNPVADACELNEVPCLSTMAPWQPWFFGRKGDPAKGFNWTYHFFWGLEDVIAVFTNLWKSVATNRRVGGLFPNDSDGNAWGDPKLGLPPALAAQGFTLADPGRYQNMTQTFASHISAFKREGVDIVTGVVIPPDMKTFLTQARQQGFKPKVVSVAKALLYPATVEAVGDLAEGVTTEVWWSPSHPYASSLTKQSAKALADAYEAGTKKQWTQPIGFSHTLFELAVDAFKRTKDVGSKAAIRDAVATTNLQTVVGPVKFGGAGSMRNVSKTPLVGGQWVKGTRTRYELVIVNNQSAPAIPTAGALRLL
ncbi:MAG: ABC transporter substrate-binding protein [Proteobacteria bacterium]|nr:ABC transporter substrate-binding protein [Pseudomonadota bacterium]